MAEPAEKLMYSFEAIDHLDDEYVFGLSSNFY